MRDVVVWHNGFKLQFRSGESTSGCGSEQMCPNQWCAPGAAPKETTSSAQADIDDMLHRRSAALSHPSGGAESLVKRKAGDQCVHGPIAHGFDRQGGDGAINAMKTADGKKCSGSTMLNTSGCMDTDCAVLCCGDELCTAWVHGIAAGCDEVNHDPNAICCWTKHVSTQISVHVGNNLSTGEVAGHGGAPAPGPGPGPGPAPWQPPLAPLPPAGKTMYSTLVYTYEWPTTDTPRSTKGGAASDGEVRSPRLVDRLAELTDLLAQGLITSGEHTAARKVALLSRL